MLGRLIKSPNLFDLNHMTLFTIKKYFCSAKKESYKACHIQ